MTKFKKINNIASWIFLIIMICLLGLSIFSLLGNRNSDEPRFVLGHRLIYLTSGSMEPAIKTNAMALTRETNSMDDIEVGDIISFKITDERDGKTYRTTHRVVDKNDVDKQFITKGDNNAVTDAYPISIDQVESKVVLTMNWTADLVSIWTSGRSGKLLIIGCIILLIALYYIIKTLIKSIVQYKHKKKENTTKE